MKGLFLFKMPRLSIRLKVVALLVGALSVSLLSYLYIGTSLVVEDKISYIYDYNLAQVKAVAEATASQIQNALTTVTVMSNVVNPQLPAANRAAAEQFYNYYSKNVSLTGVLFLRASSGGFNLEMELGPNGPELHSALDQTGWTPQAYAQKEVLIGSSVNGKIPLGRKSADAQGKEIYVFTLLSLKADLLADTGKDSMIHLVDGLGRTLVEKDGFKKIADANAVSAFEKTLQSGAFRTGVRDWNSPGGAFMVAYHRLPWAGLTVVSYVTREVAFKAAKSLATRALALELSLLALAVGLTLIFVKGLTRKLRELWHATQKVGEGDFAVRVDIKGRMDDEISDLAGSFNTMADKIQELLRQTAEKARMEKELETAKVLQQRFFPAESFSHPNLVLSGIFTPAAECAGDWWYYCHVGKYLIVVEGDVTGHGVSSAFVTAAAHGTFALIMDELKEALKIRAVTPSLASIVKYLNSSVLAAAGGDTKMTFIASIIDLETGSMTSANCSHRNPYLHRPIEVEPGAEPLPLNKSFKALIMNPSPSLGEAGPIQLQPKTHQLEPGDMVIWYTDGLIEGTSPDGHRLSKTLLFEMIAAQREKHGNDTAQIAAGLVQAYRDFLGSRTAPLEDDVTVVIGVVPKDAQFKQLGRPVADSEKGKAA